MKTIIAICPSCKDHHALVWYNTKSKRVLSVICDNKPAVRLNRAHDHVIVDHTKFVPVEYAPTEPGQLDGIPEHFTPAARRKAADAGNLQFIIRAVKTSD